VVLAVQATRLARELETIANAAPRASRDAPASSGWNVGVLAGVAIELVGKVGDLADADVQAGGDLAYRAPRRIRPGPLDPHERGDGDVRGVREVFLCQLTRLPQLADCAREPSVSIGRSGHSATFAETKRLDQRVRTM
jgi:hypothetical protein